MRASGFVVHQLRFVAEVETPLELPPHKGSSLRGALFGALRDQFCLAPRACGLPTAARACPVCFLLAPAAEAAPRGRDLPRPYVLRPPADARTRYEPGERFAFHLLTFGRALSHLPYALLGVEELGRRGLGRARARLRLAEVWAENPLVGRTERVYQAPDPTVVAPRLPITGQHVQAEAGRLATAPALTLRVRLPLRLIEAGRLLKAEGWSLRVFFQRLLERIATLSHLYGRPLDPPFRELLAASERAEVLEQKLLWRDLFRYSGRQGRRLPMGGLVGDVTFRLERSGHQPELLPWLVWGQFTHVGKYADHGNGWYELIPAG